MNPLILDTDGGIDDAQALIMLLSQGIRPIAVTTVFGNVPLGQASRNMAGTLAHCDAAEIPVICGMDRPMAQPMVNAMDVHGEDGLGGAALPEDLPAFDRRHAVTYLIETLNAAATSGRRIDMLMIGPLTNLAMALLQAPGIEAGIGQLTIMGATLWGRGNTTPAAEFNIYADPEAADVVFRADIATRVVPWEPCTRHVMTGAELDALFATLPDDALGRFNSRISKRTREVAEAFGTGDVFQFVDPFAAAVVIDPELIDVAEEASVAVALAPGLTRGMTLIDPSRRLGTPPVTMIEQGRLDRLKDLYIASVKWRPGQNARTETPPETTATGHPVAPTA